MSRPGCRVRTSSMRRGVALGQMVPILGEAVAPEALLSLTGPPRLRAPRQQLDIHPTCAHRGHDLRTWGYGRPTA